MRVALVAGGLPFGGSTTYTLYLAAGLQNLGVATEVFSFTVSNPLGAEFERENVPVHRQDETRLIFEDRLANVYSAVRKFRPTAVIAIIGVEAYELLRYVCKPVMRIGIVHDLGMTPAELLPPRAKALDRVVVVAKYLQDAIRRCAPGIATVHISPGIPIPTGCTTERSRETGPLRLLYYGRLIQASKQVRIFPEIVRALNDRQVPFKWTIHGQGPDETFLRDRLAREIGSGRVAMSSPVAAAELQNMIQEHDIYVLASLDEGGPLTLLESMAFGLVPVCGDIPGLVQDVITPDNGFRVPVGVPAAYANAIAKLHLDRSLLQRTSAAARSTITSAFGSETMARNYVTLIASSRVDDTTPIWPKKIRVRPIQQHKLHKRFLSSAWATRFRRLAKRVGFPSSI